MGFVRITKAVIVGLVAAVSFWYGQDIPFKEQVTAFDALRNTSAIIFAVMGAWIAIIYPNALSKIFGKAKLDEKTAEFTRIQSLLVPMIYSAAIISFVLVAGIAGPITKQIPVLIHYCKEIRGLSYAVIGCLTTLQVLSIVLALVPGYMIQKDIKNVLKNENRKNRLQSRISKK